MYIATSALPKAQAEICIASETSLLIAPPERPRLAVNGMS
jgi:hypothetical protein